MHFALSLYLMWCTYIARAIFSLIFVNLLVYKFMAFIVNTVHDQTIRLF